METARQLLSAHSPDAELDRLYPLVTRHHVAPAVLETLRCAGGQLAELSVDSGLVASLRPFNRLLPELTEDPPGRVPLSELALAIRRHTTHLEAVVQGLSDRRLTERFVLLFGAALRLVAPSYRRLSNDLDLFTPGAAGGVALVRELRDRWGLVLVQKRTWPHQGRELAHFDLLTTTDDGHELHVDVIAGGRPARSDLVPAFVEPKLFERSRTITLDGMRVRVPSTEDMLLWLADKVGRRGRLTLRDVHDAWVLASNESDRTDWPLVLEASTRYGLIGILSGLLALAEQVNGQIAVERDAHRILIPSGDYSAVFETSRRRFDWERVFEWKWVVEGVRRLVAEAVPEGAVVLVVNRGDETLLQLGKRTGWHFPRGGSGEYAGCYPADSNEAIAELEHLRGLGATHLVFPSTERWWLEHYGGFREHLDSHHGEVASTTAGIAFQLCDGRS